MSNLGQMVSDLQSRGAVQKPRKKKQPTSSVSESELKTPRDISIHNFKCEGQGTEETFQAYNKRTRKIAKLGRAWKPYQRTLDQLRKQYETAVQAVKEQANHIDDDIIQLKKDNTDNCPHPVSDQRFDEKHHYFDWEQHWEIDEWTTCGLCGKTVLRKTNGKIRTTV